MSATVVLWACASADCDESATIVCLADDHAVLTCAEHELADARDTIGLCDWYFGDDYDVGVVPDEARRLLETSGVELAGHLEPLREFYEQCRPEDFELVEAAIAAARPQPTEDELAFEREVQAYGRGFDVSESSTTPEREPSVRELEPNADLPRALLTGGAVLDIPDEVATVWGASDRVAWAEGERLMICAPQGAGKTTLAQRLALARCGLGDGKVLGLPVVDDGRKVLYIAADRPAQALRSLRRMITPADRAVLDGRLIVWKGGLLDDVVADPDCLLAFVKAVAARFGDVGTVIIDSLKDLAPGLEDGKVGSAVDHALRKLSDADVQVLVLHHPRKGVHQANSGDGGKLSTNSGRVRSLEDCYGSTWLTSGCGSVLALNGKPGASRVELSTLKPVVDDVGPFDVVIDHATGALHARGDDVTLEVLVAAGNLGVTKKDAAAELELGDNKAAMEKAGRWLDRLVEAGLAEREDGGNRIPSKWFATPAAKARVTRNSHDLRDRVTSRDQVTGGHEPHKFGSATGHAWSRGTFVTPSPLIGGDGDVTWEHPGADAPDGLSGTDVDDPPATPADVFDELDALRLKRAADPTLTDDHHPTDDDKSTGGAS